MGRKFVNYAILGDDLVIADERVALLYRDLVTKCLDVEISISIGSSLISPTGAAEFGFRVRRITKDISPISLRKLMRGCSPMATGSSFNTCDGLCTYFNSI